MVPARSPRSDNSAPADVAYPDDAVERRLLGAILVGRKMPTVGISAEHFISEDHARIYAAMFALAAVGRPITSVTVWQRDRGIDPVYLAGVVAAFAVDRECQPSLVNVYGGELLDCFRARRRRPGEAA